MSDTARYPVVMLIDDNELDNFINKKLLENEKFADKILVHQSAQSALEELNKLENNPEQLPRIIFLDIMMPHLDGFGFLEEMSKLSDKIKQNSKIMKKLLLSISLLLISFLNYSQNSNIKFGIHAGLNYSTFYGYDIPAAFDPVYSESPAFAYLGGINFEYQIKEKLSLKLELNYERKSQKADNNIVIMDINGYPNNYNFTSKKNNDYLVLPPAAASIS